MNGFERRRKEKEKIIIDTALRLFKKNGIQDTLVSQIAREAGVSQVTIFKYFETKDKLIETVINYFVNESFDIFESIVMKNIPFEHKIQDIIFMKKTYAEESHQDFLVKFMELYSDNNSFIKNLYNTKGLDLYKRLFQQGRLEGKINRIISDKALYLYFDMFSEYLSREDIRSDIKPLTEEIMNLFLYGISGKTGDGSMSYRT